MELKELQREQEFLQLCNQFLQNLISATDFSDQFINLWCINRDEQYARQDPSSKLIRQKLGESLSRGDIGSDEFEREYNKSLGWSDLEHRFVDMCDQIHCACDCLDDQDRDIRILKDDLYRIVEGKLSKYLEYRKNSL